METRTAVTAMLLAVAVFTVIVSAVAAAQIDGTNANADADSLSSDSLLPWFALFVGSTSIALAIGLGALVSRVLAHGGGFDSDALKTVSLRVPDPVEDIDGQSHPTGGN